MKNINDVSNKILTIEQKAYLHNLYNTNNAVVFPDRSLTKLLSIIDDLAERLNDEKAN